MTGDGLRVLLTADAVGGVWTYASSLAAGLAARGADVTLAVLGPVPDPAGLAGALAALGPAVAIVETGLPLDWLAEDAASIGRAGRALADLACDVGAEIVHLNAPAALAGTPFPCPVVVACHSCLATWWDAVRGTALPADFAWRTALVRQAYGEADALIAPTVAFARVTAARYGLARMPDVVPNGVATAVEGTLVAAAPYVLAAGRLWDEGKGIAVLEEAARALPLPVMAAGPTEGPNGARISLTTIRALGPLAPAAMAAQVAARPILCAPSLYEPFGLTVLEAASAGCPLVLSDIATFRELWDGAARFAPPGDAPALAAALADLATDPVLRAGLAEAALVRSRRYGLDATRDGTLAVYGRALASAAPRPWSLAS